MGYCKSMKIARESAQANANYFQVPYCVFFDTSGNARCEPYHNQTVYDRDKDVYQPDSEYKGNTWADWV